MREFDIFFRSIGNALEIIGGLPSSYIYHFTDDSFIMATGVRFADENWAWITSENYSRELLVEVVKKFESISLQFIWPIFPNSDAQMEIDMDEFGLLKRAAMSAMIFDSNLDFVCSSDSRFKTTKASTSEEALLWADVCWRGFSEGEGAQPEFVEFARSAVFNDNLKLILGYIESEPVGSYMLCENRGIYISHFCVLPKWRNLGVGSLLMSEIMEYNNMAQNSTIVLLATSSGERLYKRFGFRNIANIPIRSFSDEI
jgi:ribosomal protein S18 acetylase RimI-like enzyme